MTSNEHYKKALAILKEVEDAEAEASEVLAAYDELKNWNDNVQRRLKVAEIHATLALVRKDA